MHSKLNSIMDDIHFLFINSDRIEGHESLVCDAVASGMIEVGLNVSPSRLAEYLCHQSKFEYLCGLVWEYGNNSLNAAYKLKTIQRFCGKDWLAPESFSALSDPTYPDLNTASQAA